MNVRISSRAYDKFLRRKGDLSVKGSYTKEILTLSHHKDGSVCFALDEAKLRTHYLKKDQLISFCRVKKEFDMLIGMLSRICGEEVSIDMSRESEVKRAVEKVLHEQKEQRVIEIEEDLTLRSSYPREMFAFNGHAWDIKRQNKAYVGRLVDPLYIERDINKWRSTGFRFRASKIAMRNMSDELRRAEEAHDTASFTKTDRGFLVEYDSRRKEMTDLILRQLTVSFLKKDKSLEELEFASFQIRQRKIRMSCHMFALPTVLKTCRDSGMRFFPGLEELMPGLPSLPVHLEMKDGLELRDIQDRALRAWSNHRFGTISIPPGSGKTMIPIVVMSKLQLCTLIVVPSLELVDHWKKEILKWTNIPEDLIGTYSGEKKEVRPITIITYQSGQRAVRDEFIKEFADLSSRFGFLVMDEGHHSPAPMFRSIMLSMMTPIRMSLTATAKRSDGNERLSFVACGDVVCSATYGEVAEQGVVSPIVYEQRRVMLTEEETDLVYLKAKMLDHRVNAVKLRRDEASTEEWADHEQSKSDTHDELKSMFKKSIYNSLEYDENERVENRMIFGYCEKKLEEMVSIIRSHRGSKILIFTELKKGARLVSHYLRKHRFKNKILTGSMRNREERRGIFDEFVTGKTKIIVTTTVLDEGANVPDCDVGIVIHGSEKPLQNTQRCGRVSRFRPSKIAYFYELIAQVDHRNYKKEYQTCRKFSSISTFEIKAAQARNLDKIIDVTTMRRLISGNPAKKVHACV